MDDQLRYNEEKYHHEMDGEENAIIHAVRNLASEVDCRIGHGAESNGHLEYVKRKLDEIIHTKN
jgi:hypothetical protein